MTYQPTAAVEAAFCPSDPRLAAQDLVPLGAAVWTGSGALAQRGITAIAQAASGSMLKSGQGYDPTRDSLAACVANSLRLATGQGYDGLAIPFIASGAFGGRMHPVADKIEMATIIAHAAAAHRRNVAAVIVAWDAGDHAIFAPVVAALGDPGVTLVQGSITDHHLHGCAAIANAANMEVSFGGGISGSIGKATGDAAGIDTAARAEIRAFWQANPPG